MIRFWYSLFFYSISPLIWIYLLLRAIKAPEYRDGFLQRLGIVSSDKKTGGILVHCASVGETIAATPLIQQLLATYPEKIITVTTSTPTGKKTVTERFGNKVQHLYMPGDWLGAVRRFLNTLDPQLIILMETELWFNFLTCCNQQRRPVLLANARLSEKSLKQYLKFPRFSKQLFNRLTVIAAQYSNDKNNFKSVGVEESKLLVSGSIKFDVSVSESLKRAQVSLKNQWAGERPVWIAASIHPGEFEALLNTHRELLKLIPNLLLIAVPRHPEQFSAFKKSCEQHSLSYVNRSRQESPDANIQVVVGDTMGEMMLLCGVADIAYVGGSLIERGGHNPLEPVACGIPVVMGPHVYNFSEITDKLRHAEILSIVGDGKQLTQQLSVLLTDESLRLKKSSLCESFMAKNQGTVERILEQIKSLINAQ
ncbi:3-deoxy-D-manno-octulosonic acid transferase [Aliikangiella marina]|uniref:3-deoxy-D-manno-octulosonic acid transferase n=1 Tax=Aliikangiella marina TaxID=1712262 RepID=A0A545TGY3_9GAMM|nr:lipid IV(A) 3-deoxy-D-manno-octulosonic acid transferase [Aliikangiella marina]TQV76489.1 3-deoxy-D-manno-octulosonic acid transferase [Aliikangiella marina]